MPKPQRHDAAKEKRWRRLLRQWQRSGLTGRDFCAAHGLSEPSFYAWRRAIARRDLEPTTPLPSGTLPSARRVAGDPAFLEVTLAAGTAAPSTIDVIVGPGRLLRVGLGFDADLLRRLVRVLEEPAC